MADPLGGWWQFEGYELDLARWQVRYSEEVLPLTRKTFDLLLYLVEHADRVVTKDELLRTLWPDQFIEESNLTQQVFLLRKALTRHNSGAKLIETVPGRGYRFAVPVRFEPRPEPQEPQRVVGISATAAEPSGAIAFFPGSRGSAHPADSDTLPATNRGPFWVLGALLAALVVVLLFPHVRHPARVNIAAYTQITHDGRAKSIGGTDGSRIYFTRLEKSAIAQVSISGKGEALLPLTVQDPWSGAVSPDGSTLLIVSQASGQGPASSLWSLQLVTGALRRLGNAVSSAWSPDGEQIVYATASGELCVMRPDGSNASRLASVGGNIGSVAWSPDGHILRFSRDGVLWQISPDGSNLRQVLPGWGKSPRQWSGEWAPNGDYFFVAEGQIWMIEAGRSLIPYTTPEPIQLTFGPTVWDHPIASRDGRTLLASGRTARGELVRFEGTTADPKPILGGISAEFVTFSKAANAVAYVSFPDGVLWRANPDGGNPVPLTEPPTYPKSICWSPDGTQMAFVDRTANKPSAIFTVRADGSAKPQPLLPRHNAPETDPSWSPDGRKIVFSTAPNVGASAQSDLRVLDLGTGSVTPVPGSDGLVVPHWSPDGRAIVAMTLDVNSLRVLDLGTGKWSSLDTGAVAFPEWSRDARWIYYVRWTAHPALLRIRVADGKQEVLADLTGQRYTGAFTLWMGLDPADRPMMLRDTGADDIYALKIQR